MVQGMGAGEAVDALSAQEPRKSWQMRKRQERAALKEGLAEWQAGVLIARSSQQASSHWKLIRHSSCAAFEWPAGIWTRAPKKSLLCGLIAETVNRERSCAGKPLLCGWEVYSASYHRHPLCILLQQVRHRHRSPRLTSVLYPLFAVSFKLCLCSPDQDLIAVSCAIQVYADQPDGGAGGR